MTDSSLLGTATPRQETLAEGPFSDWIVPNYPLRLPEVVALVATVALWDLAAYSGLSYWALALFLAVAPLLWVFGSPSRDSLRISWMLWAMLAALAVRMVWLGSPFAVFIGACLMIAFAMSLANFRPFPPEAFLFTGQSVLGGFVGQLARLKNKKIKGVSIETGWRSILIPACFVAGFSAIFIFANPVIRDRIRLFFEWLSRFPVSFERFMFWTVSLWVAGGLIRPLVRKPFKNFMERPERDDWLALISVPFDLFSIARNTLVAVVALFVPYLFFEFYYLWIREIPEGFYYSGYAHQGAFWLTVALALSTFTLGFIFRGPLLEHPRLELLKKLTWIWCVQNFVLALCVLHRVEIYIQYNGLSKMRVIALYGITAVFIGFLLVVWKVLKGMNLLWLLRRDLTALFTVCFVYALTPVDIITTRYNVSEILEGNHAPSVLLSVHPIGPEGIPELLPLTEAEEPIIREGAWALLATSKATLDSEDARDAAFGWKGRQLARERAIGLLNAYRDRWKESAEGLDLNFARQRFDEYARQWYD